MSKRSIRNHVVKKNKFLAFLETSCEVLFHFVTFLFLFCFVILLSLLCVFLPISLIFT